MDAMLGFRVCHIASGDLWAGAEVQLANLLYELKRDPSLEVRVILLNKGVLYSRLNAYGIPTEVLDERELSSLEIARQLYRMNRAWKPHVVHTHRYKENSLGGLAASCAQVPVIVHTVHGIREALSGWENIKWRVYSLFATQVTKRVASGLIGVSKEIADILQEEFPHVEVACIYNGIRSDSVGRMGRAELSREKEGIETSSFVIGAVGRLTPVKGIEYLLQAVAILIRQGNIPSIQVVIVGEGPLRTTLEGLVKQLGIYGHVLFMGRREDVQSLLPLFDTFVMPSLHEGISMALLEALAAGRPVIASAVGGTPEVIRDGIEGLLVPPKDPTALARAIQDLYESPPLRTRFQLAGPERVATEFSAELMASRTIDFYRQLLMLR